MIQLTVDRKPVEVEPGATLLDALKSAGREIPTVCHDERLAPSGACRVCLVSVEGQSRLVAACACPAVEGMNVTTDDPELIESRKAVLTFMAREYPGERIDAFPEKGFHRWLKLYGLEHEAQGRSDRDRLDASNPYFMFDRSACIECYRCVRICSEVQGSFVWQIVNRGPETRIVPDSLSEMAQSTCKSCGACVDSCPTSALVDHTRWREGLADSWTRTVCPYCGVGCELEVGVTANRIVQVLPARDAPVNKGHVCVKGRYAHQYVHASDRISEPMLRKGGEWEVVSWEEAIEFVASRLTELRDRHGPDSIGILGSSRAPNEDNYIAQKFARVVLGTNNVDCCARVCHAPTAAAMKSILGTGAATNSYDDIERAGTILVIGSNPSVNHPVVGERIKQAKLRGANLIVIDPKAIELAKYADVHVQLRPGTNVPLLNSMMHVILEEGLEDSEYLNRRIDGVEEFREFVRDYAPEKVGPICGVCPSTIREAARLYATARPSMSVHGLGMTEHLQGTEGVQCLVNLALLTGNIGVEGGGVNPLRGQNNVQGSAHMGCEPSNLTGHVAVSSAPAAFLERWGRPLPEVQGLNLMQMLDAAEVGQLKAMWVIGYDVYLTNPSAEKTARALESMELVIVQDLFLNESARLFAHVFLPAAASFERPGTFMNAERRVQLLRKAIDPPGNALPDWEIMQRVAQAMGETEGFSFADECAIWDEVRSLWPVGAGLSYARLEKGGLQWPCPTEDHPGTTVLHKDRFPTGERTALKQITYIPSPEVVSDSFPFLLNSGRDLYHLNAATMTGRTENSRLRPTDTLDILPSDARRLGLEEGESVRIVSRFGEAVLPVRFDRGLRPGEVFATFHSPKVFLNKTTSTVRDRVTGTPEYKRTAVRIERLR